MDSGWLKICDVKEPDNFSFKSYPVEVEDFRAHVIEGFSASPKYLSPRFFYDTRGSEIFEQITRLPEYYPTETEKKILCDNAAELNELLPGKLSVIEPGSGNSEKVELLFDRIHGIRQYIPVEISGTHLKQRCLALAQRYPSIHMDAVEADYMSERFSLMKVLQQGLEPVVFFPGSSLGNYVRTKAIEVLKRFRQMCGSCHLLIGIDLVKDPGILERAYNDSQGVTAEFNKNLIVRMRNQLGFDIHPDDFEHRAVYNPRESRIEIFLISRRDQVITTYGHTFHLEEGEAILTEYSHKYTIKSFYKLAGEAGFRPAKTFIDDQSLFSVHVMKG